MWLSKSETDELLELGEILDPESMLPGQAEILDGVAGLCPIGHGILTRARVYADETFYIERCHACHGMWFDAGEWEKLADNARLHDLHAVWDPDYQRKQRAAAAEESHREKLRGLLGAELLEAIDALAVKLNAHEHRGTAVAYLLEQVEKR